MLLAARKARVYYCQDSPSLVVASDCALGYSGCERGEEMDRVDWKVMQFGRVTTSVTWRIVLINLVDRRERLRAMLLTQLYQ
jgi:hypothetical protein